MHFLFNHVKPLAGLMAFFLLLVSPSALAIDPLLSLKIGEAEAKLLTLERTLNDPKARIELPVLRELQEQGLFIKTIANDCIQRNEQSINKNASALELLGEQSANEEKEVTEKRQSLNKDMLGSAQQLASCRLLLLRSQEMVDHALARQQQELADELLARRTTILDNVKFNLLNPLEVIDAVADFIEADSGIEHVWENAYLFTGLLLLAVVISLLVKRWLKSGLARHRSGEHSGYLNQFQQALMISLNRMLPPLMLFALFGLYYLYRYFAGHAWDFTGLAFTGLFLYVLVILVIRILFNPVPEAGALTSLPDDIARLLARRLRLLAKLLLAGFLLFFAFHTRDFPTEINGLVRNIYLCLLVLNLIWAVWLLRHYEVVSNIHFIRAMIIVALLISLVADWMGYTNLADFILAGILGSMLLWALTIFVLRIWSDLMDSLDEGRSSWQQRFRKIIGVQQDEFIPGSIWFRFTFALVLWSLFAVILLKIWGLPDTTLILLRESVLDGFEIGGVRVVPIKIVFSLLGFAVMLSIIGWIKRRMDKSWLKRSRMDRGAKEAMISLTSYLAVAIATLIALSVAGIELSNIALIAGALSVGIGFGLQNIVNNFISGVILLFERPIKTGDWIVVGGTEGYVRKISIRSTQIQTFDRSDVIVPNSELISSQVTNMMLRDSIGRIVVPVGVAYGSDVEKVKSILLDIAFQHPDVISQSPILPKPWVLFREFADSSLNFELRAFIKIVDNRLSIISEVNFAIDKAFREAGIQIPFPQRDVHVISETGDESLPNKDREVITKES